MIDRCMQCDQIAGVCRSLWLLCRISFLSERPHSASLS